MKLLRKIHTCLKREQCHWWGQKYCTTPQAGLEVSHSAHSLSVPGSVAMSPQFAPWHLSFGSWQTGIFQCEAPHLLQRKEENFSSVSGNGYFSTCGHCLKKSRVPSCQNRSSHAHQPKPKMLKTALVLYPTQSLLHEVSSCQGCLEASEQWTCLWSPIATLRTGFMFSLP